MKFNHVYALLILVSGIIATGCSTTPSADNYGKYMNQPEVQNGDEGKINEKKLNQQAWSEVEITKMTSVRRMADGSYSNNPHEGLMHVRAVLVNEGDRPIQGHWRCKFYDSNNLPLNEEENNRNASHDEGLGWHTMVVYPVKSKSQRDDANVIKCMAPSKLATNYRIEFHDTSNDITEYTR
ncbi:hypothetical protein [Aquella oligotrophica]|uniref:DUF4352 domain-containing protein n=1 Tax=Aquella oligotrophica TaxID=2067065 RepID=A0A2I7N6U5_9NEIS|nr:hypothetical protein [Aquella oligotrophica]AUR52160.1 hypothetical protein CUN60_07545 [Aquella oligotrophica]